MSTAEADISLLSGHSAVTLRLLWSSELKHRWLCPIGVPLPGVRTSASASLPLQCLEVKSKAFSPEGFSE